MTAQLSLCLDQFAALGCWDKGPGATAKSTRYEHETGRVLISHDGAGKWTVSRYIAGDTGKTFRSVSTHADPDEALTGAARVLDAFGDDGSIEALVAEMRVVEAARAAAKAARAVAA